MSNKKARKNAPGSPGDSEESSAARVRAFRQQLGVSQAKLAAQLGVTVTTVSNWETGRTRPLKEHYIKMGNIAPELPTLVDFWLRAGIDRSRLQDIAAAINSRQDKK